MSISIKNKKVSDALNGLISRHPFFASLVLKMEYIEDLNCKTFWTDGKKIGYNPDFANSLSFDEIMGVLAHEACHVFLLHHFRLGSRDKEIFNKAADYVVNYQLVQSGFKLPKNVLLDSRFTNTNAEDVYRILMQEQDKKEEENKKNNNSSSDSEDSDLGFGEIREPEEKDLEGAEEKALFDGKMAESMAKMCGNMPVGMERLLADVRKVKTDWREILNRFLNEISAKDYSFMRANRRHLVRRLVLPSLYSKTIGKVVVAVDCSGSVSGSELEKLIAEVSAILDNINESKDSAEIDVIYFDGGVTGHEIYSGQRLTPKGGGGTCFKAPINYINEQELNPDLVIILTDGYSYSFPPTPDYPVLWAITVSYGDSKMPFGEVMKLN